MVEHDFDQLLRNLEATATTPVDADRGWIRLAKRLYAPRRRAAAWIWLAGGGALALVLATVLTASTPLGALPIALMQVQETPEVLTDGFAATAGDTLLTSTKAGAETPTSSRHLNLPEPEALGAIRPTSSGTKTTPQSAGTRARDGASRKESPSLNVPTASRSPAVGQEAVADSTIRTGVHQLLARVQPMPLKEVGADKQRLTVPDAVVDSPAAKALGVGLASPGESSSVLGEWLAAYVPMLALQPVASLAEELPLSRIEPVVLARPAQRVRLSLEALVGPAYAYGFPSGQELQVLPQGYAHAGVGLSRSFNAWSVSTYLTYSVTRLRVAGLSTLSNFDLGERFSGDDFLGASNTGNNGSTNTFPLTQHALGLGLELERQFGASPWRVGLRYDALKSIQSAQNQWTHDRVTHQLSGRLYFAPARIQHWSLFASMATDLNSRYNAGLEDTRPKNHLQPGLGLTYRF